MTPVPSVFFGMPVMIRVPDVVGVRFTGRLRQGVLATDLALTVTERRSVLNRTPLEVTAPTDTPPPSPPVDVEPRASFGQDARFCFDDETGAPTNSRVEYSGGIVEVLAVTAVTDDVGVTAGQEP